MVRLSRVAPEIPVSDLEGALKFYEQKLGFRIVAELPSGDYAIVERDDVVLHLFRDDTQKLSPASLHIFTQQLDEFRQELLRRGTSLAQEIVRQPWGNRDLRVNDEWGNQLKFTEPLPEES